ncbi:carboxy-lyase [Fragilaria crotonensis]|nr:carboxy-lyase [Fragilaria crotonensis]
MRYSINNLGDPFVPSNYGVHSRQFECAVIDFFAHLFKATPDETWGPVLSHGLPFDFYFTNGRNRLRHFAQELALNRDKPAIINVNIGTTVKGAVDNLDRILQILQDLEIPRDRYYIHCDGALFAMMMPLDNAPEISFRKNIDSITVSGHKMLGCPMPCGIALSRKEHVRKVEERIDYLNSVDTTIMGLETAKALSTCGILKKSIAGIKEDVLQCMNTARYLEEKITSIGLMPSQRPQHHCRLGATLDDALVKRWQLACEEDIAHVVVMPNVTRPKIDQFVHELEECKYKFGRTKPAREGSPLMQLSSNLWGGELKNSAEPWQRPSFSGVAESA